MAAAHERGSDFILGSERLLAGDVWDFDAVVFSWWFRYMLTSGRARVL